MKLLLLYCSIFSLFIFTNGGGYIQQYLPLYYDETQDSQESNKELLQCMQKLFEQLFAVHQKEGNEKDKDAVMTESLYQNSQCVIKSIQSSEKLVRLFGLFVDKIKKLKAPEMEQKTRKEKKKAEQNVYKMAVEIVNELYTGTDHEMLSKLSRTITSFLKSTRPPKRTDTDDQATQFQSQALLGCLAYHFNATFQFNLPKEIKQQDKLSDMYLRWNSGCITVTAKKSKRVLYYLAKTFKDLFNLKPKGRSTKEQKYFYKNIKRITDELPYKIGQNATITGWRMLTLLIDRILVPEAIVNDPDIKITRDTFDGVPVIIHEPVKRSSKLLPGLMYYHGGGWVYRTADTYLPQTIYLAKNLDAVVISVDYRRAPEYRFPVPVDDCFTATKYFMNNAKKFKVDPGRIGVSGDSAGGNMATIISLRMRDSKLKTPKVQVLIYPCVQMMTFNLPSHQQNKYMIGLTREAGIELILTYIDVNVSFKDALSEDKHVCNDIKHSRQGSYIDLNVIPDEYKQNYTIKESDCDPIVAEAVKKTMLNPYAFPLMANDLSNLPPALIITEEFDVLRDEGLIYGSRLKKSGVRLEEHLIKGGYHGAIDYLHILDISKHIMDIIVKYLKENL